MNTHNVNPNNEPTLYAGDTFDYDFATGTFTKVLPVGSEPAQGSYLVVDGGGYLYTKNNPYLTFFSTADLKWKKIEDGTNTLESGRYTIGALTAAKTISAHSLEDNESAKILDIDGVFGTFPLTLDLGGSISYIGGDGEPATETMPFTLSQAGDDYTLIRRGNDWQLDDDAAISQPAGSSWATSGEKHEGSHGGFFADGPHSIPFTFVNKDDGDKLLVVKTVASYDGIVDVLVGTTAGADDLANIDDITPGNIGSRLILKDLVDGQTYHVTITADGDADTEAIEWCVIDPFYLPVIPDNSSHANAYARIFPEGEPFDLTTWENPRDLTLVLILADGPATVIYGNFMDPQTLELPDLKTGFFKFEGDGWFPVSDEHNPLTLSSSAIAAGYSLNAQELSVPSLDTIATVRPLDTTANREIITTGNASGVGGFGLSTLFFHLSTDPAVIQNAAEVILPVGVPVDLYLVGPVVDHLPSTAGVTHNGTTQGFHVQAIWDGASVIYNMISNIRVHPHDGSWATRTYDWIDDNKTAAFTIAIENWENIFSQVVAADNQKNLYFKASSCYEEPGATLPSIDNYSFLDEISPAQLATLPVGPHMRWTATSPIKLNMLEIARLGTATSTTISWASSNGQSGSETVAGAGNPLAFDLDGITLSVGETIDFTLDDLTDGQMQLCTPAQATANNWTALQDYSAFANSDYWSSRLIVSEIPIIHDIKTHNDGTTDRLIEFIDGLPVEHASIPASWVLKPEPVDIEDRLNVLEMLHKNVVNFNVNPVEAGDTTVVFHWNPNNNNNDITGDEFKITDDPASTARLTEVIIQDGETKRLYLIGPIAPPNVGGIVLDVLNTDGALSYTHVEQRFTDNVDYLSASYDDMNESNATVGVFGIAEGERVFTLDAALVPDSDSTQPDNNVMDATLVTWDQTSGTLLFNEAQIANGDSSIYDGTITQNGKLRTFRFMLEHDRDEETTYDFAALVPAGAKIVSAPYPATDNVAHECPTEVAYTRASDTAIRIDRANALDSVCNYWVELTFEYP